MALFVEVDSVEKNATVIINLDHVIEIAPLFEGGCVLFMNDSAGVNTRYGLKVRNDYTAFKQFAMQTVSAEDIARRFPKAPVEEQKQREFVKREEKPKVEDELEIPTLGSKTKK